MPKMLSKLRLHLQPSNIVSGSGFVKIFASWSLEEMNLICSSFCITHSRIKWKSTSMCLVRAWKTGLEDRYVAPMLSHQRTGGWFWEIPNSLSRDCTHIISAVALAIVVYSALVLLRDIVACLRALQAIKFNPKNIACLPVDSRSSRLPA
jgi:hypothetical protein